MDTKETLVTKLLEYISHLDKMKEQENKENEPENNTNIHHQCVGRS
jgi:hypothetical protein